MQGHQPTMYEIIPSGDYLHVVCVKCEESCELDYKGRDPVKLRSFSSVPFLA